MSRGRYGLIIAGDSNSLTNDTVYDTRKSKLTVDPDVTPKHFDILLNFSGGTKWSVANTDTTIYSEDLFKIKHGLPFKPQFAAYFYPTLTPSGSTVKPQQYSMNMQLMLFNAISLGQEWLEADTNETYFYIRHKAQRFGFGGPNPYVFNGSDFSFKIRYFIFNRPSFLITGGVAPQS